ncbi:carboxyltransferase domain-containing protein [Candidatus Pelagibacter ubique]|nr:carboxyltransferase domain-containing protein [Candidatus Pelagibacter ubique]
MVKNISNLGDAAVYCDFGSEVNEKTNANVIDYFHHISKLIKDKKIEGIINLTPSYNKLIINFDLSITDYKKIKNFIEGLTISRDIKDNNQKIRIPVCCDDEYGLDFFEAN